jgi:hypothetical protein
VYEWNRFDPMGRWAVAIEAAEATKDWLGSFPAVDWDGDSVLTGLDSLAQDTMIGWAMGFSVFESCSAEDPSALVCVGVWDGQPRAR